MTTKKLLGLLLVAALTLGLLAGCSGGGGSTPAPATTGGGAPVSSGAPAPVESDLSEHMTISIALWDFADGTGDPRIEAVEKACNVTIEPRPISWDNDLEQIKLFAAADDLPDSTGTYATNSDIARFYQWIDQGLVRSIPYEMTAKFPLLKQLTDTSVGLASIASLKGGLNWFIPRLDSPKGLHKASQAKIYYRKDWMANVGITKVPETLEECYDLWKAYTYNDPDGNGKADTFGLTFPRATTALMTSFGTDPGQWYKEDGQWIPGYYSDSMIDALEYHQKMYREGILDPEYQIESWSQSVEKITTNVAGSLLRNGDLNWVWSHIHERWGVANPETEDPLTVWDFLPPPKRDANTPAVWSAKLDTGANEISSKVDDKKLERIMYMMEFVLSDEGQYLKHYGIEGETYDIVDGSVVLRIDPETGKPYDMTARGWTGGAFFSWVEWGFDYITDAERYRGTLEPAYRDLEAKYTALYDAACEPADFTPRIMSTPAKDSLTIDANNSLMGIIVGDQDVATAFAAFKQDCLNKGLQAAIDEVTAEMAKLGK